MRQILRPWTVLLISFMPLKCLKLSTTMERHNNSQLRSQKHHDGSKRCLDLCHTMLAKVIVMLDDNWSISCSATMRWWHSLSSEDVYCHSSLLDSMFQPKRGHALRLLLLTNLGAGPAQCGRPRALLWGDPIALRQRRPDFYWQSLASFPFCFLLGWEYNGLLLLW